MNDYESPKFGPEAMVNRKTRIRSSTRRSGGALIEMAFTLQLLLWLSMGCVEFGQYFYIKHCFESAARDGCRTAILGTATEAAVTTAITNTLAQANVTFNSSWLTISDLDAVTTVTNVANVPQGDRIEVALSTSYYQIPNVCRPLYSITGKGIGNGKQMTAECTMYKE